MINHASILDTYVSEQIRLKQQDVDQNIQNPSIKKVKYTSAVIDFIVRWSSTFKMVNRFNKLRSIINDITHTPENIDGLKPEQRTKLCRLAFSHSDWNWLSSLEYVLQPFEQSTSLLSGRSYQTLAIAKIVMNGLQHFLSTYKSDEPMVNYLKKQLLEKYEEHCEFTVSEDTEAVMTVSVIIHEHDFSFYFYRLLHF